MPKHVINGRLRDEDLPASPGVSRAIVLGFLIAGLIGLAIGVAWVGWHLLARITG